MAFAGGNANGQAQAHSAQDLEEIDQDRLGFQAISGDTKVKLLPKPWPSDNLPPSTSSLLDVASRRGLVAAAGPDTLIVDTTDNVRQAFIDGPQSEDDPKTRIYASPKTSLNIPRVSHVAFTADENALIVAAEQGGGLAVYDVSALANGSKESAFQIATNGTSLRVLQPNPTPEFAHLVAVVLSDGKLLLANLQDKSLANGINGPVIFEGVSSFSWSRKGKAFVAGLANGTCIQMRTDQGAPKPMSTMPIPPTIAADSGYHVSAIYWLAQDDFFISHTPAPTPDWIDSNTIHHVAHRVEKNSSNFSFHRFPTPIVYDSPGSTRPAPAAFYVQRLTDWKPHLDDLLVLAQSHAPDLGMLARTSAPLSNDYDASKITNTWVQATVPDTRRAGLPMMSDGMEETVPIGMALYLSSKETVPKPIPSASDAILESPYPLPGVMVLNNEGTLSAWWIVYDDSIREGQKYSGLVGEGRAESSSTPASGQQRQPTPFGASQPAQTSPFGGIAKPAAPSFGTSAFGKAATPAFGSNSGSAFGGTSIIGNSSSPWANTNGTTQGAAKPAFGAPSTFGAGTGFGAVGGLGQRPSPWSNGGSAAAQAPSTPAASPFGGAANKPSGFASFASSNQGGIASPFSGFGGVASPFGQPAKPAQSAFATAQPATSSAGPSFGMSTEPSFGSTVTIDSNTGGSTVSSGGFGGFGSQTQSQTSMFGQAPQNKETAMNDAGEDMERTDSQNTVKPSQTLEGTGKGLFGAPSNGFTLGSTLQGDGSAKDDLKKPDSKSLFGGGFADALEDESKEPATPVKKEPGAENSAKDLSTTPTSPPKQAPKGNLFGEITSTPPSKPVTESQTPADEPPAPLPPDFTQPKKKPVEEEDEVPPLAGSPPIKVEAPDSPLSAAPESEDDVGPEDAPLPPDFTKTPVKAIPEDAPLPPDPIAQPTPKNQFAIGSPAQPSSTPQQPLPKPTPKSQFFGTPTPAVSLPPAPTPPRQPSPLRQSQLPSNTPFGFPKPAPFLPPPTQRPQESPRSPSPVRSITEPAATRRQPPAAAQPVPRPQSRQAQPPPELEPEPQVEDLDDEEDARIRAELEAPTRPTKKLEPFLPYQDYLSTAAVKSDLGKPNYLKSIDRLYRDINSMIDTVGYNVRNMESFVRGHTELYKDVDRTKEDLEIDFDACEDHGWCLDELENLILVEDEIAQDLEEGRVDDVEEKLDELLSIRKDTARLRSQVQNVKKVLDAQQETNSPTKLRSAPLDPDQSQQQRTLRTSMAELQKRLADAEEAIILLKTRIASAGGKGNERNVPTVEAVEKTIRKMTSMVQQKSGDIDVLEQQMRKLRTGTPTRSLQSSFMGMSISSKDGMNGSPFATPPTNRRGVKVEPDSTKGRTYGFSYDDEEDDEELDPRLKTLGITAERAQALLGRRIKQVKVKDRLREGLLSKGVRVTQS